MFFGRKGNYPIILTDFTCCIFFVLILKSRHSRLFLKSRSKTEPESSCSSVIIFLILLLHVIFLSASASCDILDDNNLKKKKRFIFQSFSVYLFPPSALPSLAMDLCWTSTSASAGEDSTIQAEWPSMATKVGYKSLCDVKIHFAARCQMKNFNLSKVNSSS